MAEVSQWNRPKKAGDGGRGATALPNGKSSYANRKGRPLARGLLAALVVVIGAGLAFYFICGQSETPAPSAPKDKKRGKIAEVEPAKIAKPKKETKTANATAGSDKAKAEKPKFEKRPGALQLPDGTVLTFPPPKGDEIRKVYAYGHLYECDSQGNFRDITKRQLFHTAFEANFLGLANADKPFIPAFLTGLDQDEVKKLLQKPYEPIGDETEQEITELKNYDMMRSAALQYMDEGGTFDDFVDYFAQQVKDERQTNALCLREVMTLYKEGRVEEAKEMAEAAAALKAQKNLKPFKVPAHVQAAFDAID